MVKLLSNHLKSKERALIRKFSHFTLRKMVKPSVLRNSIITIRIITPEELENYEDKKDLKSVGAWCSYGGVVNGKKSFSVFLNANGCSGINKQGKKPITRLKNLLLNLGHELTHVKQYLNNEVFDYVSGDVRFKGDVFEAHHERDMEAYFESPWEIEAHGREWGLFILFKNKLKEEAIAKKRLTR